MTLMMAEKVVKEIKTTRGNGTCWLHAIQPKKGQPDMLFGQEITGPKSSHTASPSDGQPIRMENLRRRRIWQFMCYPGRQEQKEARTSSICHYANLGNHFPFLSLFLHPARTTSQTCDMGKISKYLMNCKVLCP